MLCTEKEIILECFKILIVPANTCNQLYVNAVSVTACDSPVCTCAEKCTALWYPDWHHGSSVPGGAVPQHACSPPGERSCDVPDMGTASVQVAGQEGTQAPVGVGWLPAKQTAVSSSGTQHLRNANESVSLLVMCHSTDEL